MTAAEAKERLLHSKMPNDAERREYDHYTNGFDEAVTRVENFPAADVAPVVRCKDCEYSYDEISYLCCSHGVCFDCEVPPNFYCAEGKRKEPDE